jgi:hypothetical protein
LENHTSSDQQKQMAAILNKHFGKKILKITGMFRENHYQKLWNLRAFQENKPQSIRG